MYVASKLGIGTTSPVTPLTVQGGALTQGTIQINNDVSTGRPNAIKFLQTDNTPRADLKKGCVSMGIATGGSAYGGNFYVATQSVNQGSTGTPPCDVTQDGVVGNVAMAINPSNGNVGIGTTSPWGGSSPFSSAKLQVRPGTNENLLVTDNSNLVGVTLHAVNDAVSANIPLELRGNPTVFTTGNVGIGTTTPGYTLTVNGTAWCTSGAWSGSDLRWKENIAPLANPLEKISRLRGVEFDWKRSELKEHHFPEGKQIGIIAQEMEKEFPELVTTDASGYKAIAYDRFTAVLLEAMKEQQKQLQKDREGIEYLKQELLRSTAMLLKSTETLTTQTKEIQDIRQELTSKSTVPLLEAINTIKAQTKELQDLKAEIVSLKGKVTSRQ